MSINASYTNGDMLLQYGCSTKTAAEHRIDFNTRFGADPVVVISPFWDGSGHGVGHTETIDSVADDHFVVISNNAASNYSVNYLAVGPRDGVEFPDPPIFRIGDLLLQFGRQNRARPGLWAIPFTESYPSDRVMQVSPFWERQHRRVGQPETLRSGNPDTLILESGNAADNFYTMWTAFGSASGEPGIGRYPLERGATVIQTGSVRKASSDLSIGFPNRFNIPPVVLVSPS